MPEEVPSRRRTQRLRATVRRAAIPVAVAVAAGALALVSQAAELHVAELDGAANDVTVEQGGEAPFSIRASADGAITCATGVSLPPTTVFFDTRYALDSSGAVTSSDRSSALDFFSSGAEHGSSGNCDVTWHGAPTPYAVPSCVTAAAGTPTGDYTVPLSEQINSSPPTAASGKLVDNNPPNLTVHVVPRGTSPASCGPPQQVVLPERVEPPHPKLGETELLTPVSGLVLVRIAGRTVPLRGVTEVPNGTIVDSTHGVLKVTVAHDATGAEDDIQAWAGAFKVGQGKGATPITHFVLVNGLTGGSGATAASTGHAARRHRRFLWLRHRHGRFRSRGRHASAIVRGTYWLTRDTSAGTLVRVKKGAVKVHDFTLHRTVIVRAGHSYLAPAKRPRVRPRFTG